MSNETHELPRASVPTRVWRHTFNSLDSSGYRWFWVSSLFSLMGLHMQMLARGWLVYDMTRSPLNLGWVSFAFGLPILLLAPVSGVFIDRIGKRSLLIITQVMAAVLNLSIAILITLGTIEVWHIVVGSVITGAIFAFNVPARNSAIPHLVERHQLMNAVALNSGAMNVTTVASPALAGLLIGIIGIESVYYVSVGMYAIACVFLLLIPVLAAPARTAGATVRSEAFAGISYMRHNSSLLGVFVFACVLITFGMSYHVLMPAFAADVLDVGASGLGILMAAVGLGAVTGSLLVASLGNFKRKGRLLLVAGAAFGVLLMFFAASGHYYLSLILLFAVGAANTTFGATSNTLIQFLCSDQMRSRVMGVHMVTVALFSMGVLAVGAIGEFVGVQMAVGIGAGVIMLFTLATAILRPDLKKL